MSLHGIEIALEHYTGRSKGVVKTEPLDVIYAIRGGQKRKIGYVAHCDNAAVLLVRHLKIDLREPVRREVERIRLETGGCSVSKIIASPPDPDLIKAYIKGDLKKTPKTTIVMPDGSPAQEPQTEVDDDE